MDHLVEEGLVSRQENPQDRRMLMLQLTDKGKALLVKLRRGKVLVYVRREHMVLTKPSKGG